MEKSRYNDLQNYTIKITYNNNNGSGVVFSIEDRIAVLTAFHVLGNECELDEKNLYFMRFINGTEYKIDFEVKEYYYEEKTDLALILIESSETFHEIVIEKPNICQSIEMYGYPDILSQSDVIPTYGLHGIIKEVNNNKICVTITDKLGTVTTEEKNTLDGYSGGGFYRISEGEIRLCGIETGVLTVDVTYNAVCGASADAVLQICARANINEKVLISRDTVSEIVRHSDLYVKHRLLIPLDDFPKKSDSKQRIEDEYREGVDAHPDHIRKNLDIRRDQWIKRIQDSLLRKSIVIIRGASGQGKTSLAYRYLIDHYSEDQIICIRRLSTENFIGPILQFLRKELINRNYVLYYDVQPGDKFWPQFLINISEFLFDVHVIVTIREEDFNIGDIRQGKVSYEEIELELNEEEAREIYSHYNQDEFLSFDDIWKYFVKGGPLLEFIYLLNHSKTLKEKIDSQVKQIDDTVDERDWFSVLAIIAIAGQYDISVKTDNLLEVVNIKNITKLLQQFEREFFIRMSNDGERIICLHAIRARLIIESLGNKFGFNYGNALLKTLSIIDDNALYLLLEYIEKKGLNKEYINKLSDINYTSLSVVEDVLRGLLWCSIVEYHRVNKEIIEKGNMLCNNAYIMLALGDITGLLDTEGMAEGFWALADEQQPGISNKIKELVKKQPQRHLEYNYPILFLENISDYLKDYVSNNTVEGRSLGYILFWANKLGVSIDIDSEITIDNPADYIGVAELVKGLISHGLMTQAKKLKNQYEIELLKDCNVVILYRAKDEIFAEAIPDYYSTSENNNSLKSSGLNEKCMYVINVLSCLYPDKRIYNVQLLGTKLGDITIPDTEKHIPKEKLPDKWITELNGICNQLQEYYYSPQDWKEVYDNINSYRNMITDFSEEFLKQITKFYKKGNFVNLNINKLISGLKDQKGFDLPKCARDRFGIKKDIDIYKTKNTGKKLRMDDCGESLKSDNIDENDIQNNQLWIGEVCSNYFKGISYYINGLHNMMSGLIDNEDPNEYCRIPLFNIVSSYELYRVFNEKVYTYFSAYTTVVDAERERINLEKVVAITHWIYCNGYRKEKDVVYRAHELFKKKRREIDYFFEHKLEKTPGIKKVLKAGNNIWIYTNIEQTDKLIELLFQNIQNLVGENSWISPAKGYLFNSIDNVCLILSNEEYENFQTIFIPIRDFIIARDMGELRNYIMTADRTFSVIPQEYIKKEAVDSVLFISNQISQIEESLLQKAHFSVAESIESVNESIKSELEEVSRKLEAFPDYMELYSDISEIASLDLITIDKSECQKNFQILENFFVKYEEYYLL